MVVMYNANAKTAIRLAKEVPNAAILEVTPDKAQQYLDHMVANRNPLRNKVEQYARDMLGGNWILNGETIKFNEDGRMFDGQNRMLAVVKSGVTIKTYAVFNMPEKAMDTVDTGASRQFAHLLQIQGFAYASQLAGATRVVWAFDQNPNPSQHMLIGKGVSTIELNECLTRHPRLIEYTRKASALGGVTSVPIAAAMWYLFAKRDEVLADTFFTALFEGTNLGANEPVFQLRERLIRLKPNAARSRRDIVELFIRAWNLTRKGKKVSKLVLNQTAPLPSF